jgi:hypothetical protein
MANRKFYCIVIRVGVLSESLIGPVKLDSAHHIVTRTANKEMNSTSHVITFAPDGTARCSWTDAVPLHELGRLAIECASTVEFNCRKQAWEVRLASNPESVAFSDSSREICLHWERNTINALLEM